MAPGTILDKNLESGVHLEVLADQRGSGDQKQTSELVVLGPQKSCNTNNFYPTNTRVGVDTAPHLDDGDGEDQMEPAKKGSNGPKIASERAVFVPKNCLNKNNFSPTNHRIGDGDDPDGEDPGVDPGLDPHPPSPPKGFEGPNMTTEGVILVPKSLPKNKFYHHNHRLGMRAGALDPPLDPLAPGVDPLAPGVDHLAPGEDHLAPGEDHLDHLRRGAPGQGGPLSTPEKALLGLEEGEKLAALPPVPLGGKKRKATSPGEESKAISKKKRWGAPKVQAMGPSKIAFPLQKGTPKIEDLPGLSNVNPDTTRRVGRRKVLSMALRLPLCSSPKFIPSDGSACNFQEKRDLKVDPEESVLLDTHEYKEQEAQVAVSQTSALNPIAQ